MPKREGILGQDIYSIDFAKLLPEVLKNDPKMKAFAESISRQILEVSRRIDDVLIYSRLHALPEELIDILAYDMHVDWYDYSYPLEIKRVILKNSVKVHKKMGTVYAVKTAVKELHKDCIVEEWFEYGGTPNCFKIILNVSENKLGMELDEIIKRACMCKRLSAHLEEVTIKRNFEKKVYIGIAIIERVSIRILGKE